MDKDKKVGLIVNIIVTITLFIVCVYLGFHFYNTGMETGFRKGRVAGWNTGYREGQESMMELVKEVKANSDGSQFDSGSIDRKLRDIEMKLDDAEWQRKLGQ